MQSDVIKYAMEGAAIVFINTLLSGTPVVTSENLQAGVIASFVIWGIDKYLWQYSEGFKWGTGYALSQKVIT